MDVLSSIGAIDLSCNNIISDNITAISSLTVSGVNILTALNNINSFAGSDSSSLNITGTTQINFNAGSTNLTNINASGLNVFHTRMSDFPFGPTGWYNVSERFDKLYQLMSDTPLPLISFDTDHNTCIRVTEADILEPGNPSRNYSKEILFKDFLGGYTSKVNKYGLSILDINNNWNLLNNYFTITGNSLLLCSNKTMIDAGGNLNVFEMTTYSILGVPTGTGGTWLNVADTLTNNISGVTSLNDSYTTMLSQITTISGNAANIANIANYYSGIQSSLAVTNGVVTGTGLVLAFQLKEDRYDAQYPLYKRAAISSNGESFNQLLLKYNSALTLDGSNNLTINTQGFLTPTYYGDLGLQGTPTGYTSTSSTYVVVKQLTQPMTCLSSLNVSGYTTLLNNTTCMNNLNINGALYCSSVNSATTTNLQATTTNI